MRKGNYLVYLLYAKNNDFTRVTVGKEDTFWSLFIHHCFARQVLKIEYFLTCFKRYVDCL